VLHELLGEHLESRKGLPVLRACTPEEMAIWTSMLNKHLNSPVTSSAGRLFDAVAALLGIRQVSTFEGQAAMELEYAVDTTDTGEFYGFKLAEEHTAQGSAGTPFVVDWASTIYEIMLDLYSAEPLSRIAARFHNTLAEMVIAVARKVAVRNVVLSGGCFQNAYLAERTIRRLQQEGFHPYWHRCVPPNDGGIALGQVFAVREKIVGPHAPDPGANS
jgi:hydrogenase maturation protein HypF